MVAAALSLMLAVFTVLSADVIVRVWLLRGRMESAVDAAVLLSYEAARTLTTALALGLAIASWRRASDATRRLFTLLVLFLGFWYTKAFAFAAFPGPLQERLAGWLFDTGVPRSVTTFIFGAPVWAAWLALGALLRLSALFPAPLDAAAIDRSGGNDRTGLLRGVHLAGLDVGAAFRRISTALVRVGAFGAAPVWLVVIAGGTLHALAVGPAARVLLGTLWVALLMVAVTNLRATMAEAPESGKRRVLWMLQAAIVALAAYATAAVLSIAGGRLESGVSFGFAAFAPPVILMGLALAIRRRHPPNPRHAIRRTLTLGIAAVAAAVAYVLSAGLVSGRTPPPVTTLIAVAVATMCTLLLRSGIRRVVGRIEAGVATPS
jgi:hypothetical protein